MNKKIYVIKAGIWCKIGISNNPEKRVCSISTSCPIPPELAFESRQYDIKRARVIEREVHRSLIDKQSNGEWFEVAPEEAIEQCKKHIDEYNLYDESEKQVRKRICAIWRPKPELFTLEEAKRIAYSFSQRGFKKEYCIEKHIPFPYVKIWRKKLNRSLKKYHELPDL